jgi:hypothetical protein
MRAGRILRALTSTWGAQVDLVRPGRPVLPMQIAIGVGDGVGRKPAVRQAGALVAPLFADLSVDDHMSDVNAAGPELAGYALCQRTQRKFGRGEVGEVGPPSQRGGRARENDRARPMRLAFSPIMFEHYMFSRPRGHRQIASLSGGELTCVTADTHARHTVCLVTRA